MRKRLERVRRQAPKRAIGVRELKTNAARILTDAADTARAWISSSAPVAGSNAGSGPASAACACCLRLDDRVMRGVS